MNKKMKIKPLKYYINDKEEMINQAFSCIPERQLTKLTPPSLTDMSTDELKAECLVQLLKMSDKRIERILEGRKHQETESRAIENNSEANEVLSSKSDKAANQKEKPEQDRSKEKSEAHELEANSNDISYGKRKHKEKKHKEKKKKRKRSTDEDKNDVETTGRNLLELLELEMRAKAIRSLIKKEEELEKRNEMDDESTFLKQLPGSKDKKLIEKTTVISTNETNSKIKATTEEGNWNKSKPTRPSITKKVKNIKKEYRDQINAIEKKTNNYDEKGTDNLEENKQTYDWNMEEEKLIYEDDEYESDDKVEHETSKEREKSEESSSSSWAERWLQSKDVKKVVATSKMLTVVRNKMKTNFKTNKKLTNETNSTLPRLELEGSVKEYDTLHQMHEAVMTEAKLAAMPKQK